MWISGILSILAKGFAIFCIYVVGQWFYNIFLHPLRKYPGPLASAASRIPLSYATARGEVIQWHQKLHNKYGDVVRVGPTELSYINPQAWSDIFGRRPPNANPKDWRFWKGVSGNAYSLIDTPNDQDHTRMRKIFSPAFPETALRKQEPLFRRHIDLMIRTVEVQVSDEPKPFNIVELFNFTTFDIMGDLAFGEPLNLIENSSYSPWVKAVFANVKALTFFRLLAYFPPLQDTAWYLAPKSLKDQTDEHDRYAAERVDRRLANKRNIQPDIWNLVLTQENTDTMSLDEMHENASLFMLAGTETTATLLSGLTFLLLKNQRCMNTLIEEIRGRFARESDIKIEALARLPYLNACIEEALRIYPPIPDGIPRAAPPEGTWICAKWVPGGTGMYVSSYVSYHSPSNFKHPNMFIPERWMGIPEFAQDNRAAMQPSSTGPRNCLGKNMAYHEMRLLFALFLWHFDLELVAKHENWIDQLVFTLWQKPPLMVIIRPAAQG